MSGVAVLDLDQPEAAPFVEQIALWLADANAEAVLIRPDRHVFGTGHAVDLMAAWTAALTGAPATVGGAPRPELVPTP